MASQSLNLATFLEGNTLAQQQVIFENDISNGAISARTINVTSVTTTFISEGANLYFTNAKARAAISISGTGSYDEANGIIYIGTGLSTSNVLEGANLWFTNTRARAVITPFDNSIVYNPSTGEIRANAEALYPGGPNVISVNGQVGIVTLNAANIQEYGSNVYFTNARARNAFVYDKSIQANVANGWISIGQNVRTDSNVVFYSVETKFLELKDEDQTDSTNVYYSQNANSLIFTSNLRPETSNSFAIGALGFALSELHSEYVFANALTIGNSITAPTFIGQFSGEFVKNITVTASNSSLVIDSSSNPGLFLPTGSKVIFDLGSYTLNGIGFDIGFSDGANIANSTEVQGITYSVNNVSSGYENFRASFNGANARILTFDVPYGALSNLFYYATSYETWQAPIVVSPPTDTDDITEGVNNLFFTDQRVRDSLIDVADTDVGLVFDSTVNKLTFVQDLRPTASVNFSNVTSNSFYGTFHGNIVGNFSGNLNSLGSFTTTDLPEGANLYFTTNRVRTSISGANAISYDSITGVFEIAETTANANSYGGPTQLVTVRIDEWGRVTAIGSNTLNTSNIIEGSNLFYSNDRVWANVSQSIDNLISQVTTLTTSNVSEGANLYYTNERVWANVGANIGSLNFDVSNLYSSITSVSGNVGALTTNNVAEGSNLYYTDTRVWANVGANIGTLQGNVANLNAWVAEHNTTSGITEGTNQYFTNVRVWANVGANIGSLNFNIANIYSALNSVSSGVGTLTTSNVAEGSNLYYTNARVKSYLSNFDGNIIPSTSNTYDLGSDSSYWKDLYISGGTIAMKTPGGGKVTISASGNSIIIRDITGATLLSADKDSPIVTSNTFVTGNLTTSNISEGTNQYFTNNRAWANVTAGISTLYVPETYNLYFTNARAVAAVGGQLLGTTNNVTFATVTANVFSGNKAGGSNNQLLIQQLSNVTGFLDAPTTDFTYLRYDSANGIIWGDMIGANTITYLANSITLDPSYGTYNSGNVQSIRTVGDYNLNANNYYSINETATTPGYIAYIDFSNVQTFNRITINLFYTQNSGHQINVDLWNEDTAAWDSFGQYTGLGTYYQFALSVLNDDPYIQANNTVLLRLYHVSSGNPAHNHRIDYVAIESTSQGPQGPKGTTGSTGATGPGIAVGGTEGQILYKANSTNYATYWGDLITSNIIEGSNLWYSNARANAAISAILNDSANLVTPQVHQGNFYDGSFFGNDFSFTNSLGPGGLNLKISTVDNINQDAGIIFEADDSGLAPIVFRSNTFKVYSGTTLAFRVDQNANTFVSNNLTVSGTIFGNIAGSALGSISTTDVAEGTNKYFTNARARAALTNGLGVTYNESTGSFSIGQNVSTHSDVTFANLTVTGNLLVQGNALQFESNTLIINDPLIQIGKNPTGDSVDLGFFGHYVGGSPSIERHAGLFRDATDGQFKLFTNLDPEPANLVDTANSSYQNANLVVNYLVGKVTDLTNHTTTALSEGNNLYYTNVRVYANVISHLNTSPVITRPVINNANLKDITYVTDTLKITNETGSILTIGDLAPNGKAIFSRVSSETGFAPLTLRANGYTFDIYDNAGNPAVAGAIDIALDGNVRIKKSVYADTFVGGFNVTSLVGVTTTQVPEGANLYFTNNRVWANVSANIGTLNYEVANLNIWSLAHNTTTGIAEGTRLYYTDARVWSNVGANIGTLNYNVGNLVTWVTAHNTTSGIAEGTNQYYQNTRVWANVGANIGTLQANVANLNTWAAALSTTSGVAEGSRLYYTDVRVWSNVGANIGNLNAWVASHNSTTGILEGTNLYFTNARARAAIGNTDSSLIYYEANGKFQVNVAAIGSGVSSVNGQSGTVTLTTTNINEGTNQYFTNTRVQNYLTASVGSIIPAAANTYDLGSPTLYWRDLYLSAGTISMKTASGGTVNISAAGNTLSISDATGAVLMSANATSPVVTTGTFTSGNLTTSNIQEGTNQYFTNNRVWANVSANIGNLNAWVTQHNSTSGIVEGSRLYYLDTRVWSNVGANIGTLNANVANLNTWAAALSTTSGVAEGTRLYFTNARSRAAVGTSNPSTLIYYEANGNFQINVQTIGTVTSVNGQTGSVVLTTSNIAEGSNLYYTDTRVWSNVGANIGTLQANVANLNTWVATHNSTSGIIEGSRLYYTDVRVWSNVGANIGNLNAWVASHNSTTGILEGTNQYYTNLRVWANVGANLGLLNANVANLNAWVAGHNTTTGITEGTNLYFTNARARATISAQDASIIYYESNGKLQVNVTAIGSGVSTVNGQTGTVVLTTSNIAEGSNLYYTDVRVWSNVGANIGNINAWLTAHNSTSGIVEGSRLYYTDVRVWSNVGANIGTLQANVANLNTWVSQHNTTSGVAEGSRLYYTDVRVWSNVGANIGNLNNWVSQHNTTSGIVEGTNQYYTNLRVWANVGANLGLLNANVANLNTWVATHNSTTGILEGTNLYFTNARARAAIGNTDSSLIYYESNGKFQVNVAAIGSGVSSVNGQSGTVTLTTTNIAEGTNLYYTSARVWANITSGISTTYVPEGTNLYFTNTRVQNYLTASVGSIIPSAANTYDLGSPSLFWRDLYLSAGTISMKTASGGTVNISASGNTLSVSDASGATLLNANASSPVVTTASFTAGNITTSNVQEGTRLYYLDTRVWSNVGANIGTIQANVANLNAWVAQHNTTSGIAEGSRLYYTDVRVWSNVGANIGTIQANVANLNAWVATHNSTTGILEGTNQYYTNLRVWANVGANLGLLNSNVANLNTWVATHNSTTGIIEGTNLYFTNARARAAIGNTDSSLIYYESNGKFQVNVTAIGSGVTSVNGQTGTVTLTTTNINEGTNLYFNNTRARASVSGGTGVTYIEANGQINIGQAVSPTSSPTFGNLTITGNLTLLGNGIVIESNTLAISDPLIQVGKNNNVGDVVDLGFFGHYKGGTPSVERHAGLFRDASDGQFRLFTNLDPEPTTIVDTANSTYQDANLVVSFVVGKVTDISNHTTTNLTEGTNQYFTNARVWANVSANIGNLNSWATALSSTSGVAEGSRLYYLDTRVWANVGANIGNLNNWVTQHNTTTGITEGTKLFYTDVRVWSNVGANIGTLQSNVANLNSWAAALSTTSGVAEGSRLYFTNTRARAAVGTANPSTLIYYEANGNFQVNLQTVGAVTSVNGQSGAVSLFTANITESHNTLYYTDTRVWSNVGANIGTLNANVANLNAWVAGHNTTTGITEGSKLFYTDVRVWANVGANIGNLNAWNAVHNTTTGILEGVNLYFTNTRVRAAVGTVSANATGLSYIESAGTFSLADSGATAGTYGNSALVPRITVDRYGRVTSVANTQISLVGDYSNANVASYLPIYTGNILAGNIQSGNIRVTGGTIAVSTTSGALVVTGGAGISGNIHVGGNVYITDTLFAATKSFLIDHPTKQGGKLRYASLEGPENGVYVRGRLTETNVIELPEYWSKLVDPLSVTVSLTAIGNKQNLWVTKANNQKVVVGSDTFIDCYYVIYGERIDVVKLQVEY